LGNEVLDYYAGWSIIPGRNYIVVITVMALTVRKRTQKLVVRAIAMIMDLEFTIQG